MYYLLDKKHKIKMNRAILTKINKCIQYIFSIVLLIIWICIFIGLFYFAYEFESGIVFGIGLFVFLAPFVVDRIRWNLY